MFPCISHLRVYVVKKVSTAKLLYILLILCLAFAKNILLYLFFLHEMYINFEKFKSIFRFTKLGT